MLQQFAKNWDFKTRADKKRQFQKGLLSKCKGSDYFSKKVRTPWTVFFSKIRKNTYKSILAHGTNTVIKSPLFTNVFFFVFFTEAQKSSKNNSHLLFYYNLRNSRTFCNQNCVFKIRNYVWNSLRNYRSIQTSWPLTLFSVTHRREIPNRVFFLQQTFCSNNISLNVLQQPYISIWI